MRKRNKKKGKRQHGRDKFHDLSKKQFMSSFLTHCNGCKTIANDKVYIYESELSFLGKCILEFPNIETGGQLFGYWTASGAPVVVYALGPGPNANHQVAFFNQDVEYLERVGNILVSQFGLMHIGEWHSHHHLGLDKPSGHDANTMQRSIDNLHLNRFLLCIGICNGSQFSIKPYNFIENHNEYTAASWEIKGAASPLRFTIDTYLSNLQFSAKQEQTDVGTWFSIKSNRMKLKSMMDFLKAKPGAIDSKAQLKDNIVEIIATFNNRVEVISFPSDFPKSPISILVQFNNGNKQEVSPNISNIDDTAEDIFEIFKQQYNSIYL